MRGPVIGDNYSISSCLPFWAVVVRIISTVSNSQRKRNQSRLHRTPPGWVASGNKPNFPEGGSAPGTHNRALALVSPAHVVQATPGCCSNAMRLRPCSWWPPSIGAQVSCTTSAVGESSVITISICTQIRFARPRASGRATFAPHTTVWGHGCLVVFLIEFAGCHTGQSTAKEKGQMKELMFYIDFDTAANAFP